MPPGETHPLRSKFVRWAAAIILVMFAVFKVAEHQLRQGIAGDWNARIVRIGQERGAEVAAKFSSYQNEVYASTLALSSSPEIRGELARGAMADSSRIFSSLVRLAPTDLSIEIYTPDKRLLAWQGRSGPQIDSSKLGVQAVSYAVDRPLYSYLVVLIPVRTDSGGVWYVAGKRLFDANFPISNRFINNDVFSSTFTSRISSSVQFAFNGDSLLDRSIPSVTTPLYGIDSTQIGSAFVALPSLETQSEDETAPLGRGAIACELGILALAFLVIYRSSDRFPAIVRVVTRILLIWTARYALVWMDVPESLVPSSLFGPASFASPFGFGLARSIGDLLLSSGALLWSVGVAEAMLHHYGIRSAAAIPGNRAVRILLLAAGGMLSGAAIGLLLRALSAVMHSAVFDSAIMYNDPTFVFPSLELGVMLLSLAAISYSVVIAALTVVERLAVSGSRAIKSKGNAIPYLIAFIPLLAGSYLFGIVHPSPLLSQSDRCLVLAGIALLGMIRWRNDAAGSAGIGTFATILGAVLLCIPQLDDEVHRLDRSHAELLTKDIARPSDHWQSVVVNQALDQLANGDAADVLESRRSGDIEKLAFTQWAKSILSKEGNNCSVRILSQNGQVVSEFALGTTPHMNREQAFEIAPTKRYVDIESPSAKGEAQWHVGYSPIYSEAGEFLGGVWVELSSGRSAMLRGESPEFMKSDSRENFENHFRRFEVSEYDHDTLIASTNEAMTIGRRVPGSVASARNEGWIDEQISARSFESFYFPYQPEGRGGSWIVLSLEALDFRWHLYSYLRYLLFYATAGIAAGFALLIYSAATGRLPRLTFRARLTLAFVTVSSVPILILAYSNREYALEQADEAIKGRLSESTSLIAAQLDRQERIDIPSELAKLTNAHCAAIADQLDADFNVYRGAELQATSRPEIFEAELLDARLSAGAMIGMFSGNANFISQNESIGNLPYIVGYRPLRSENGAVIGVLSMPTLFRQSDVDRETTRRNVFLFGAYAIALLTALLAGTVLARQIAFPILRLRSVTARVAKGDYSSRIQSTRTDEIGELERAFDAMTANIKDSQEEKLRAQRELAWREMAQQVAHEIKNPLTPMKLSVQHLQQAQRDKAGNFSEIFAQVTRTVLEQIETLSRITSEFSQFARMPRRTIVRCGLHELLREAMRLYGQHREVTWRISLHADNDAVLADVEELRRAFVNVFRNSLQAMEYRGSIELATTLAGGSIVVTILDSGPGIAPGVKEKLFTPNFSTKTDGMGLGLTIVRKTIEDAGGTIVLENVPGKGASAVIRLPLAGGGSPV